MYNKGQIMLKFFTVDKKKTSGHSPICKKILMESSYVKNVFCNFKYNLNFLRGSRNGRLFLVSSVHFLLWLSSFQEWGTKYLPKNQHTQRKLLNFENWCSGRGAVKNWA